MKTISLLGSTGCIGGSSLSVVRQHPDAYRVSALVAGSNLDQAIRDGLEFKPDVIAIADETKAQDLKAALLGQSTQVLAGRNGVIEAASHPSDICVSAITGFAGLEPTLAALSNTKRLALANKESLVCAGPLVKSLAAENNVEIVPVDSEHSAIYQCLHEQPRGKLRKVVLTASGGPFRTWDKSDIDQAGPEQALAHPNWDMGAKISIDSASLMNKALEFIEALYLFDLLPEQIEVVVHPQSIIHSMVEYQDGSYLAQLGAPDMRAPISYALSVPDRLPINVKSLDFKTLGALTFEEPRFKDFPLLGLAQTCWYGGPSAMIAFNALNEEAVAAFLARKIRFGHIQRVVMDGLAAMPQAQVDGLEQVKAVDKAARAMAAEVMSRYT